MLKSIGHFERMKKIAWKYYHEEKWERALQTIFIAAGFMYTVNAVQTDRKMEILIGKIAASVLPEVKIRDAFSDNVVYYDSFGDIDRGLTYIYLEALISLGFRVCYITFESERSDKLLDRLAELGVGEHFFIKGDSYLQQISSLAQYVRESKAEKAFLCLKPDDVTAVATFSRFQGVMKRYMINLTDHAFWLGASISDVVINFREFGCQVCVEKRGFLGDAIAYIPYYPHERSTEFQGLSFVDNSLPLVFSGGALYKTESRDNQYYTLIDELLRTHKDVNFLYLGNGDMSKLRKLQRSYPGRVVCSSERQDFYEIMKRCAIYVSTYPYNGGLMTQYALLAGKVPVTLNCSDIDPELTVRHGESFWNFTSFEKCLQEINKLLNDEEYRRRKELLLSEFLMNAEQFHMELKHLLENGESLRACEKKQVAFEGYRRIPAENYTGLKYCRLFFRRNGLYLLRYFPFEYSLGLVAMGIERTKKSRRK